MFKFLSLPFIKLLLISTFIFSCHHPEDVPLPDPRLENVLKKTKSEFLLSGIKNKSWVIYRTIIDGQEVTPFVAPCDYDNILTFYSNGDYLQVDGPTKCDSTLPDLYDCGSWNFNETASELKINGKKFHENVTVLMLTKDLINIEFSDTLGLVQFYAKPIKYNPGHFYCDTTLIAGNN